MSVLEPIERPRITMPARETEHLENAYCDAKIILEYGLGGSTILASEMAGKTITCVETDKTWIETLDKWFAQNPPKSAPDMIWANIGPIRRWGRPKDETHWREYSKYPLEIWSLEDIPHPDIVLVDGRFRAGCVLATAFRCKQETKVLVDDYAPRTSYHPIEKFVGKPRLIGRMAEFEITPTPILAENMLEIMSLMQDPY